jgi:hypothetical protein
MPDSKPEHIVTRDGKQDVLPIEPGDNGGGAAAECPAARARLAVPAMRALEGKPVPLADRGMSTRSTPPLALSFARNLPLTQAAVEFARERHSGQVRATDGAPFLAHPIEVASILERSHYPDQVVAAAVLHDVLEQTSTAPEELEQRFGSQVAELVITLSDDPSIGDERERRAALRERVREAGGYAAAVFAADKVSKVRELRAMLARGIDVAETAAKHDHYERSLAMLEQVIPGSRVVELLRFELEELAALPPRPPRRDSSRG